MSPAAASEPHAVVAPDAHLDHRLIVGIVEPRSRVLDLGCGDGDLMFHLAHEKSAIVQGVELDEKSIYKCVEKGLSVFHGAIDTALPGFPDASFDYIVMNQSLQEVKNVDHVLEEAFRVARRVIVGFPNLAHWRARWMLAVGGRSPMTPSLPYQWYNTPNVRFLSLIDFEAYCADRKITILRRYFLGDETPVRLLPNLRAHNGLYVLRRADPKGPPPQ